MTRSPTKLRLCPSVAVAAIVCFASGQSAGPANGITSAAGTVLAAGNPASGAADGSALQRPRHGQGGDPYAMTSALEAAESEGSEEKDAPPDSPAEAGSLNDFIAAPTLPQQPATWVGRHAQSSVPSGRPRGPPPAVRA